MWHSPLSFFTDPILRAPTIGCILMCFAASLVGVLIFLRKQSLIGESLSHAAYPGVMMGIIASGIFAIDEEQEELISIPIMIGGFFSVLLGIGMIQILERKLKVSSDAALCFILSSFFGVGVTLASQVQFRYSNLYRQINVYLYGQAATMTDVYILIYSFLSVLILLVLILFYKELQVILFDRTFAKSLGIKVNLIDTLVFILTGLAIVIGIRSVGIVLMSAMLVAPAATARQYTHRLSMMLILAACVGILSAYLGNYLSVELSTFLALKYPNARIALPTGPMIVLVASLLCILSLVLAPEGRLLSRFVLACYRKGE